MLTQRAVVNLPFDRHPFAITGPPGWTFNMTEQYDAGAETMFPHSHLYRGHIVHLHCHTEYIIGFLIASTWPAA